MNTSYIQKLKLTIILYRIKNISILKIPIIKSKYFLILYIYDHNF